MMAEITHDKRLAVKVDGQQTIIFDELYLRLVGPKGVQIDERVLDEWQRGVLAFAGYLLGVTPELEPFRLER